MAPERVAPSSVDIVICGGGLAGLCLARQLDLEAPGRSVLVLEKSRRPLPVAAHKVGESTIETGAYYFAQVLGLEDYVESAHLEKLGLRYFYSGPSAELSGRGEFGVARYLPAKSYQLDRGLFEDELRRRVDASPARLLEGARVLDVALGDGDEPHVVTYRDDAGEQRVRARWVVDALGRRRLLQRQLGLEKPARRKHSSAWFRIAGRLSVDRWVGEDAAPWHERVSVDRWNSTNHLMGTGYWVWLIPLSSNHTSVGIVVDEALHPAEEFNTPQRARSWLERHEPVLSEHLGAQPLVDFKVLRNYSHSATQVFSAARWACVGEAGAFADPFYSVGSNMIAFANGLTSEMIQREFAGDLEGSYVEFANRLYLGLSDALTETIHRAYPYHGNPTVMPLKTIWDYYIGWTTTDPQFYHRVYLDERRSRAMSNLLSTTIVTQGRMLQLFDDWARHPPRRQPVFIDYIEDLPTLRGLFVRNLPSPAGADFRHVLANLREAIQRIEELAQVIFLMAVEDVLPEHAPALRRRGWLNVAAIGLDPERWEADGLYSPRTAPRELGSITAEIARLFVPLDSAPATDATAQAGAPLG